MDEQGRRGKFNISVTVMLDEETERILDEVARKYEGNRSMAVRAMLRWVDEKRKGGQQHGGATDGAKPR